MKFPCHVDKAAAFVTAKELSDNNWSTCAVEAARRGLVSWFPHSVPKDWHTPLPLQRFAYSISCKVNIWRARTAKLVSTRMLFCFKAQSQNFAHFQMIAKMMEQLVWIFGFDEVVYSEIPQTDEVLSMYFLSTVITLHSMGIVKQDRCDRTRAATNILIIFYNFSSQYDQPANNK